MNKMLTVKELKAMDRAELERLLPYFAIVHTRQPFEELAFYNRDGKLLADRFAGDKGYWLYRLVEKYCINKVYLANESIYSGWADKFPVWMISPREFDGSYVHYLYDDTTSFEQLVEMYHESRFRTLMKQGA